MLLGAPYIFIRDKRQVSYVIEFLSLSSVPSSLLGVLGVSQKRKFDTALSKETSKEMGQLWNNEAYKYTYTTFTDLYIFYNLTCDSAGISTKLGDGLCNVIFMAPHTASVLSGLSRESRDNIINRSSAEKPRWCHVNHPATKHIGLTVYRYIISTAALILRTINPMDLFNLPNQ